MHGLVNQPNYETALKAYDDLLKDNKDPLQVIINMQHNLQTNLNSLYPDRCKSPDSLKTVEDKYEWLKDNKTAFDDEFREMVESLPGMEMSEKERSAVWKKWKSKYNEIRQRTWDDLSDVEKLEAKFEFIDALHFFINMSFPFELTAKDMFIMYYLKNAENFNRWNSQGY